MAKKKKSCICHECEVTFDIVTTSVEGSGLVPQLCPFCGDAIDIEDKRPLLKDFDEYDDFDDDKYYVDDELEDD